MFKIFENQLGNVIVTGIAALLVLSLFFYIISLIIRNIKVLRDITKKLVDYFYLVLIPFPVLYLIAYAAFIKDGILSADFFISKEVAMTLKELSIWFFTAGIFSATIKYLNTISYVKNKYKDIILSDEFDKVLSKKLEILAYSKEYLKEHADVDELWRNVTLIKYESEFPSIYQKLKESISNDFNKKDTSFYYKFFNLDIDLKLLDNNKDIEFNIETNFTIVRPNKEKFEWKFSYKVLRQDNGDESDNLLVYRLNKKNNTQIEYNGKDPEIEPLENFDLVRLSYELEGELDYHIKNTRKFIQNIEEDRFYGLGSERIFDGLKVNIEHCDKLSVFFSGVNDINFQKIEKKNKNSQTYFYNEVIKPGEKFKLFLIRNS